MRALNEAGADAYSQRKRSTKMTTKVTLKAKVMRRSSKIAKRNTTMKKRKSLMMRGTNLMTMKSRPAARQVRESRIETS